MDINDVFGMTQNSSLPRKSAIYVWGYNQSGQTGRKGKDHQLRVPRQLRPDLFGCPVEANCRWLDIDCGREHTAAVASDGSLFTWGLAYSYFLMTRDFVSFDMFISKFILSFKALGIQAFFSDLLGLFQISGPFGKLK